MAKRDLVVHIIGDSSSLNKALGSSSKQVKRFEGTVTGIGRSITGTLGAIGASFGAVAVADQIRKSISAASDLNEQISKSNVVFEDSAAVITAWSKTTATSLGISSRAALAAASTFGTIFDQAGESSQEAARLSKNVVGLASDLASFNNTSVDDALLALRSGLSGEIEPLRRYQVFLTEAAVAQEAMRQTGKKNSKELTQGEKILARYSLILRQTAKQQGDFGRTSEGLANQQRILSAQVDNLRVSIGQALIPVVTRVVRNLNEWLSSSENQKRVQKEVENTVRSVSSAVSAFVDVLRPMVAFAKTAVEAVGGLRNALKLLAAVVIARKLFGIIDGLTGLTASAKTSRTQVNLLRTSLLRLGAIGLITIGIEILINRKALEKQADSFFKDHKTLARLLGVDTGANWPKIRVRTDMTELRRMRDVLADINGETDFVVQALDNMIKKLSEVILLRQKGGSAFRAGRPETVAPTPTQQVGSGVADAIAAAVKAAQDQVDALNKAIKKGKALRAKAQKSFDSLRENLGLKLDIAQTTDTTADDVAVLRQIEAAIVKEIAVMGSTLQRVRDLAQVRAQIADIASGEAQAASERARDAFDKIIDSLDLQLEKAETTKRFNDDIKVLKAIERNILERIKVEGRTTELARQLFEARQKIREKQAGATQSKQFQALGLTAEGDDPTQTLATLKKRRANILQQIKGTVLDTPKTRSVLERIAKVLGGAFGKVGKDVREKVQQMLDDIVAPLKESGRKGPLTKFRVAGIDDLIENLGLSPEQVRALRARLAGVGQGGTVASGGAAAFGAPVAGAGQAGVVAANGGIVITGPITVISDDPDKFQRQLQRKARRRGTQTTGPHAGNSMGTTR